MGLIADVFDASLIRSDGSVLATGTLQDGNIAVKVTANDIRGGKGGNILYEVHSGRDITATLNDPEFRMDFLAVQLGNDVVTGVGVAYATSKFYTVKTVSTSLQITLDNTPISGTVVIYDATGKLLSLTTDYTVSSAAVTFIAASIHAGDQVEVRSYQYNTDATTESIEIDATKFGTGVKLVLETVEIDTNENIIAKIQIQLNNAIPDGNFTLQTKSDKTGTINQIILKVLKPQTSDVLGTVMRIPVTA